MKNIVSTLFLFILCGSLFVGCKGNDKKLDTIVDYSKYSFTDVSWTRNAPNDIETTDEMVTVITIEKYNNEELHLNFDGEIRIFTR